mmetsp:Transcript_7187/g.6282  ORF Transcript_7187/g.6282 Transcript_7187/m.6282 type:complete len:94 (-) Transcript_7187:584-865(-)
MGLPGTKFMECIKEYFTEHNDFDRIGHEEELKSRGFSYGMEGIPYYFKEDGKEVYTAIKAYVYQCINAIYKNDDEINGDQLLREFFRQMSDES